MKTLVAKVAGWRFINVVSRNNMGGYDAEYGRFALPGGRIITRGDLEAWALANKQEVRYEYV